MGRSVGGLNGVAGRELRQKLVHLRVRLFDRAARLENFVQDGVDFFLRAHGAADRFERVRVFGTNVVGRAENPRGPFFARGLGNGAAFLAGAAFDRVLEPPSGDAPHRDVGDAGTRQERFAFGVAGFALTGKRRAAAEQSFGFRGVLRRENVVSGDVRRERRFGHRRFRDGKFRNDGFPGRQDFGVAFGEREKVRERRLRALRGFGLLLL